MFRVSKTFEQCCITASFFLQYKLFPQMYNYLNHNKTAAQTLKVSVELSSVKYKQVDYIVTACQKVKPVCLI